MSPKKSRKNKCVFPKKRSQNVKKSSLILHIVLSVRWDRILLANMLTYRLQAKANNVQSEHIALYILRQISNANVLAS